MWKVVRVRTFSDNYNVCSNNKNVGETICAIVASIFCDFLGKSTAAMKTEVDEYKTRLK